MSEHIIEQKNNQEEKTNTHEKNIIRVQHDKDHPYVIMNRQTACDFSLALDTQGLLTRLLCNVDHWEIRITHLMRVNRVGRDKLYRMLRELLANGYAYCYQDRSKGKYASNTWIIFETPKTEEEIQKMFPYTENPYTDKQDTENPHLISNKRERSKKKKYIYAPPKGDANEPPPPSLSDSARKKIPPKPKVPFGTGMLISRLPQHIHEEEFIKHFNLPLIATTEDQHTRLIEKYGEEKMQHAYSRLAEWKVSKAQSEPSAVKKHSDYYRITKWVMKEILDVLPGKSKKSLNRGKLAISADERAKADFNESDYTYAKRDDEYTAEERKEKDAEYERMKIQWKKDAEERELKEKSFR